MKNIFKLPDLGEGLQEAEIVEWHVTEGATVAADLPLVSVETAKAIVDIPSPRRGRIHRLYGRPHDLVHLGDPLVEFEDDAPQPGAAQGDSAQGDSAQGTAHAGAAAPAHASGDAGSVVGQVRGPATVLREPPLPTGGAGFAAKATPAVRALAHRLDVDLGIVTPSGPDDMVTVADVERVARLLKESGPLEPLRGVRRSMARAMAQAHAEVATVTVCDDADIDAWVVRHDVSPRLVRALCAGCRAEPALNAWYDARAMGRRLLAKVDVGIAIDTADGLFVAVLRDAGHQGRAGLRAGIDGIRRAVQGRTIAPEDLRGYTITLSNFGTFAGRYADPVVIPPTVAILGAGRIRDTVVAVGGQPAVHRILPLSLSFDHRAVTGGEATRFLAAVMVDLGQPE
jgi:pyruvate dehydrogenase E2 component (dihydrolipoamide acetyltransferase)